MAAGATIFIFDQNDFSYFYLQKALILPIESIGLSDQKKFEIDFQDGGHIGLPIRKDLAIDFIYRSPKFRVNYWSFGSGEVQNKFPR